MEQNKQSPWIYYCFVFLGLGTLMPWNFFITADSYWQYKFRNTTTEFSPRNEKTELQLLYTPLQVILSNVINFSFLFINALWSGESPSRNRMIRSLVLMIIFFSITTALVQVNSDSWQLEFFITTMVIIVLIIASAALFQGGLFGIAGMFPEKYMCGVVIGQSVGGIFASLARIISLVIGADDLSSAFTFFLIAVIVMILTLIIYRYLSNTKFYLEQTHLPESEKKDTGERTLGTILKEHSSIFKEIWPLGVSVCSIFVVTLAVFPVMCVRVTSISSNKVWAEKYFQPVITFLLFNIGDFVGRNAAGAFLWPKKNSKLLYVFCFLRILCIPLLMVCNHDADSSIPTWFSSDLIYALIISIFSLSNGYLSTLCMVYGPKLVSIDKAEKASGMMATMLGLGLLLGSGLSFAFGLIR